MLQFNAILFYRNPELYTLLFHTIVQLIFARNFTIVLTRLKPSVFKIIFLAPFQSTEVKFIYIFYLHN